MAERYAVAPPKSVMLFGPPGTGKTSFAKAVASRLGWPFVELFPSRLAADAPGGLAASLRDVFGDLPELESVVLFIDEVEEIAAARSGRAADPDQGVTNELLELIPAFGERSGRLLVCATNSVRALDAAFPRPGRFDYVIPVGPPDVQAREAIWRRYLGAIADHAHRAGAGGVRRGHGAARPGDDCEGPTQCPLRPAPPRGPAGGRAPR